MTNQHVTKATELLEAGFTTQADQKRALDSLRLAAEAIKRQYQKAYLAMPRDQELPGAQDFYYGFPDLHAWKQKHVDQANALYPQFAELADQMTAIAALRMTIKNAPISKAPTKAEQRAAVLQMGARKGNKEILTEKLQDVLADAISRWVESGKQGIEIVKQRLVEHGMNLKSAYPDADRNSLAVQITKRASDKNLALCEFSAERETQYLAECKSSAEFAFHSFIEKMAMKLGDKEIESVTCTGRIWNYCSVVVTCTNGEKISLRTQMILNRSKHGTLFNQWPTRIKQAA